MNTRRTRGLATLAACALAGSVWGATEPSREAASPEAARETLSKWVETQQLIAKERKDWLEGKDLLASRIEVVRGEREGLRTKLKEARDKAFEANASKSETSTQSEALHRLGDQAATALVQLETGLRALWRRLPEPLQQKVKPLYDRIPADAASTRASLAERCQNVVGILNEVNKFNNEITMITEVRTLADGKPAEVRTVYVGLAQAYYVSPTGEAGVGRPGDAGWDWTTAKGSAAQVAEAVEVLQNKAKPAFVPLPVKIQ